MDPHQYRCVSGTNGSIGIEIMRGTQFIKNMKCYLILEKISRTLLFARAKAISLLASASGTPSAMIATTLIVGCFRASMDDA